MKKAKVLEKAIYANDTEAVRALVQGGCLPAFLPGDNAPLVRRVAGLRSCGSLQVVLEAGADVNAVAEADDCMTALMVASWQAFEDVVALLLRYGAAMDKVDSDGKTALDWLAEEDWNPSHLPFEGRVAPERRRIYEALRAAGAKAEPYHAAKYDDASLMQSVLEQGADINATNLEGRTGLIVAADYGCASVIKFLLDQGADASVRDENNQTALLEAVRHGHTEVVRLLLEHDVQANAGDNEALFVAARWGHPDILQLLLAHGANPEARDEDGDTAIAIILQNEPSAFDAIEVLVRAGASWEEVNITADEAWQKIPSGNAYLSKTPVRLSTLRCLVERGADPHQRFGYEQTMLFGVLGSEEHLRYLLRLGLDANTQDEAGRTPLMCLVDRERDQICLECLYLLLEHGSNVFLKDTKGKTALDYALRWNYKPWNVPPNPVVQILHALETGTETVAQLRSRITSLAVPELSPPLLWHYDKIQDAASFLYLCQVNEGEQRVILFGKRRDNTCFQLRYSETNKAISVEPLVYEHLLEEVPVSCEQFDRLMEDAVAEGVLRLSYRFNFAVLQIPRFTYLGVQSASGEENWYKVSPWQGDASTVYPLVDIFFQGEEENQFRRLLNFS